MLRKNTPPSKGESVGPRMVAWGKRVFQFLMFHSHLPMEGVIPHRTSTTLCRRVIGDVLQLLVDPLQSHP